MYLKDIQENKKVALEPTKMNEILRTHLIDPTLLRSDDFAAFYEARKTALLDLISQAMGKTLLPAGAAVDSLEDEEDEEDTESETIEAAATT